MQTAIMKIGKPGKFDPTFGLIKYHHPLLSEPLYMIVCLGSADPIVGVGSFFDPISAENYVEKHRKALIDKEFEKSFLINR